MASKYNDVTFANLESVPTDIRRVNKMEYDRLSKRVYETVEGGKFFVFIGGNKVKYVYRYSVQPMPFDQRYLATEADSETGLSAEYAQYDGQSLQSVQLLEGAQDVFYEPIGQLTVGPPTWLDGLTLTREQMDTIVGIEIKFVDHGEYNDLGKLYSTYTAHRGKFLARYYASVSRDSGWTVPVSYFVLALSGTPIAYCTEKADDPAEMGTYFYDREGFAQGVIGEVAFQAWTVGQSRYWRWEAQVAADTGKKVVDTAANKAGDLIGDAFDGLLSGLDKFIKAILGHPLVLVGGVVLVVVVVWAATR